MSDEVRKLGKYNVKVCRDLCIGAASCLVVSPAVFELDDEQKAVIKNDAGDSEENILLAAQSCPTKAIVITEGETGEQVWPA